MSAPALGNVRLVAILAASLLAGYAGDEAYNVWWRPTGQPGGQTSAAHHSSPPQRQSPAHEPAQVALAPQASLGQ